MYFNGETQTITGTNNSNGNSAFTVGGLGNYANHEISGFVDNIFIYDRALNVAELDDLYTNGVTEVPETGSLALLGLGLAAMELIRRKKIKPKVFRIVNLATRALLVPLSFKGLYLSKANTEVFE